MGIANESLNKLCLQQVTFQVNRHYPYSTCRLHLNPRLSVYWISSLIFIEIRENILRNQIYMKSSHKNRTIFIIKIRLRLQDLFSLVFFSIFFFFTNNRVFFLFYRSETINDNISFFFWKFQGNVFDRLQAVSVYSL